MCLVTQSCPILCDSMDCNPPGSSAHGDSSKQEYWSGLPFPLPGDLPNPGIEPRSPASQADSLPSEPPGKPLNEDIINGLKIIALVFRWSPSFFKTEYFMGRNDNLFICVPSSKTESRIREISEIEKSVENKILFIYKIRNYFPLLLLNIIIFLKCCVYFISYLLGFFS